MFSLHRRNANSQLIAIQNSCLTLNIPRELTLFLLECWIFLCLPSIMQVYFIYLQTVNNCFRHLNKGNNCFLFYQDIKIKEIVWVLHKNLKRIIFYDIPPTWSFFFCVQCMSRNTSPPPPKKKPSVKNTITALKKYLHMFYLTFSA